MRAILLIAEHTNESETEMLRRSGYAVRAAADADTAMALLRHERLETVLLDLDAPIPDARAFLAGWLAGWRHGQNWASVPITALSRQDAGIMAALEAAREGRSLVFAA